jgi:hypothetical protein
MVAIRLWCAYLKETTSAPGSLRRHHIAWVLPLSLTDKTRSSRFDRPSLHRVGAQWDLSHVRQSPRSIAASCGSTTSCRSNVTAGSQCVASSTHQLTPRRQIIRHNLRLTCKPDMCHVTAHTSHGRARDGLARHWAPAERGQAAELAGAGTQGCSPHSGCAAFDLVLERALRLRWGRADAHARNGSHRLPPGGGLSAFQTRWLVGRILYRVWLAGRQAICLAHCGPTNAGSQAFHGRE